MDPSVWPMRAKVREYIYFAKRAPRQDNGQAEPAHQRGGGHAEQVAAVRGVQVGPQAGSGDQGQGG